MDTMGTTSENEERRCCEASASQPTANGPAVTGAELFKALGDPTRLGILRLLARHDEPVCVCDITGHFALNQPTISHHLKLLREAGLVSASRRGTWAYYSARPERLLAAREALGELVGDRLVR
jgi:ArsR family transcriptional regulator